MKTYTVTVTRAAPLSSNADLSNLTLSAGTLTPAFAPGTTSYTASVSNATTSITETPTAAQPNATITVNGSPVVSGTPSGSIPGVVRTQHHHHGGDRAGWCDDETYTVTVTRAASNVATLSNLTLSAGTLNPSFDPVVLSYTASVSNSTTSITETPTATEPNATITVNGNAVAWGLRAPRFRWRWARIPSPRW